MTRPWMRLSLRYPDRPSAAKRQRALDAYYDPDCPPSEKAALRDRLILANLPLVRRFAIAYSMPTLPADDLFGHGVAGLIEAIDLFDPARGASFGTVASWRIKLHIRRALPETGFLIRPPEERFWAAVKDRPDDELDETALAARRAMRTRMGLGPRRAGRDGEPMPASFADRSDDARDPSVKASRAEEIARLRDAIARLPERQRQAVELMFLGDDGPSSAPKVGRMLNLSKSAVNYRIVDAFENLREMLGVA